MSRPGGALLAALLGLLALAPASGSAGATGATGAARPAAAADADLLHLDEQSALVDPEGVFTATVSTTGAPPGARVEVILHTRVSTRSQFRLTVDGESLGRAVKTFPVVDLADLPTAGTDAFVVDIPIRDTGPDTTRPRLTVGGVYPVEISLYDSRGVLLDSLVTHLIRIPDPDDESDPLTVAVVVPFHARPALQPDGTTELDDGERGALVQTSAELLRRPGVPVSLAATPETLDALAAVTESGDDDLLASLRQSAVARQVVAMPYVPLAIGSWVDGAMRHRFEASATRGTDVLTERLHAPVPTIWIGDETATPAAIEMLRDLGVTRVVLPESAMQPLDSDDFSRTLTRRFDIEANDVTVEGAVADPGLAAWAGATDDPVLDAHHLLADLATLYFDEPATRRGAVVRIADSWEADARFLGAVLTGLQQSALFRAATLNEFFSRVPRSTPAGGEASGDDKVLRRQLATEDPPSLGSFTAGLARAEATVETYRAAASRSPAIDSLDRRLLVAGAVDLSPDERAAYLAGVQDSVGEEFAKVEAPADQSITLTARTGQIPITVHNTAGYPIKVVLRFQSDKLDFPNLPDGTSAITLTEETTRIEVTVRARASGDSPLDVTILTPDRRIELGKTTFRVRSTAVSAVALVLSIGAGLFLLIWWIRTIRRDRQRLRTG